MMHKCSKEVNGCLDENGVCKRGYQTTVVVPATFFDSKGFPIYRREKEEDLKVVPYNNEILLDWSGHANVEWCGSTYTCVYLYKYLFKGSKKEKFRLKNADDIDDRDEINLYLRGRVLCSMDAAWRIMGYQTYPRTNPYVRTIHVKLEDHVRMLQVEEKMCDILIYFNRPKLTFFDSLKFTDFFNQFCYHKKKLPVRFRNRPQLENIDWFLIHVENIGSVFIFKRTKPSDIITRMSMLYPNVGELWYLRLLLLNLPFRYLISKFKNSII